MSEFILNAPQRYWQCPGERTGPPAHPFYSLDTFTKGYVEAMFFTNGDTGDDRENLLNEMGVERLTKAAVTAIADYCATFEADNVNLLQEAYARDYSEEQSGHDLWFTAQGHGVGYWCREVLEADALGGALSEAAKEAGERTVEAWRGWIHFR